MEGSPAETTGQIRSLDGQLVILDIDLAAFLGVTPEHLNALVDERRPGVEREFAVPIGRKELRDLVQLAAKHQITDAMVLAGDSDFLPAIEVAKQEGVVVHLFHGANPHNDLLTRCDERVRIDGGFVDAIKRR